jgi:exodeoxyribonuclease VII small subunit
MTTDPASRVARMAGQTPDTELSYEQARDELIETVRRLEAGGTTLEESLALWQRGEQLAEVCQRWLDGARAKLDAAVKQSEESDR